MIICIPYIVNDNYRVARLGVPQDATPMFIKETSSNKEELFHFEERFYAFNPESGLGQRGENDFNFEIVENQCTVNNHLSTHTAEVKLAVKKTPFVIPTKDNKGATTKCARFTTPEGLSVEGGRVFFNLKKLGHTRNSVSTIIVKLFDVEEEDMEYTFGINATQIENIYDIVIDFGSEASQVWINHRTLESEHVGNQMPLFRNIKDTSLCSAAKDTDIYQYDPSDANLYRSLFFINKKITKNYIERADLTFINEESSLITMLKDMVALPNLKLMDHNKVYLPNFNFNGAVTNIFTKSDDLRAEILQFFFETALKHVNSLASKQQQLTCKLTFLVPNTYKQSTLSKVNNQLIKDINNLFTTLAANNDDNPLIHLKPGVEVTTFSESDASFFGWYLPTNYSSQGDQRMLIIDIGKGTTDFSVLCVKGGVGRVEIERNARSGFVGAGNVMTFAILVSAVQILSDRLGPTKLSDIHDAIKTIAYDSDWGKKSQLYRMLEQLKRNEPIEGRTSLKEFIGTYSIGTLHNIKLVNIGKWIDILQEACKEHCYIEDNDPVVLTYAKLMANRLMEELEYVFDLSQDNRKKMPIHKVIFSGRGAKSKPLKEAIKARISVIFNTIQDKDIITLDDCDIKTGCLKGPLNPSLRLDHMNMPIVGWPLQMNFQPLKRNNGNDGSQHLQDDSKRRWPIGWLKDIAEKIRDEEDRLTDNDIDEEEELRRELMKMQKVPSTNSLIMSKIQGIPVNICGNGNRFVLGNRRCFVDINNTQLGEKHIFFDGEDFVARDASASYKFIYEPNPSDENFITETLFPMTGNSTKITMKGVMDVLTALPTGMEDIAYDDDDFSNENQVNGDLKNEQLSDKRKDDDDDFAV